MIKIVRNGRLAAAVVLTAAAMLAASAQASATTLESPYLQSPVDLPGLRPTQLAATADGSIWFSSPRSWLDTPPEFGRIGQDGVVTVLAEESVSPLLASGAAVFWLGADAIEGQTTTGEPIRLPPRRHHALQSLLAVGADGAIWYRREADGRHGSRRAEIDRVQEGRLTTRVPVAAERTLQTPAVGSDGAYWVVDAGPVTPASARRSRGSVVPRARPTLLRISAAGDRSRFPLPKGRTPGMLAAGPEGSVFLSEARTRAGAYAQTSIDRVAPSGDLRQTVLPQISELSNLAFGPDDDLWFVGRKEAGPEEIDSMTPSGVLATPTCVDPTCRLDAGPLAVGAGGELFVSATLGYGGPGGGGTGLVGLQASEAAGAVVGRFLPPTSAIAVGP